MDASQDVDRALLAATAPGADPELEGELIERVHSSPGALLDLALRHGVANADVHVDPSAWNRSHPGGLPVRPGSRIVSVH